MRWLFALGLSFSICAQTARDLSVERTAPPLPGNQTRWALVVGVSSYKYAPPHAQLQYAHRDAEEFARLLRAPEGGALPAANIRLLTEETATLGAIRAAIHSWLPRSASPNDIVYIYFAGHAVAADHGQNYFIAHDSDPQNLHATAIPFQELNLALTRELHAASVVLLADACHAGSIGWTADPAALPAAAQRSLEALGTRDRSFLKLLAARPSERSFESEKWGGGHGVFTYSLLNALRGQADGDHDGFVRVSELIDHLARAVPAETGAQQNPRVAGNFDAAMPLAALPADSPLRPAAPATLRLTGAPATPVYLDGQFRGAIRPTGDLRIDTAAGPHLLSADLLFHQTLEHPLTLASGPNALALEELPEFALLKMKAAIRTGSLLGPGGAWEQYRARTLPAPQQAEAAAMMMAALEDTAMECVSDYVQSTSNALKRPMFLRSAEAFQILSTLRPDDVTLPAKALFCQARAHIAVNEFPQAIQLLNRSIATQPDFACSHNALGVALRNSGRLEEARQSFESAARLAPAWGLPQLELARQQINAGNLRGAVPHLEEAVKLSPKAIGTWWSLARVHRLLGNAPDFARAANAILALDRNYAPIYPELGLFYEVTQNPARAAQAYDTYLLLAPNFTDSAQVRSRAQSLRQPPPAPAKRPTLKKDNEK